MKGEIKMVEKEKPMLVSVINVRNYLTKDL